MIKQIQLRGLSSDPSDRMTSDGGCAESLNVQLNNDELAPVPIPSDISPEIGVPSTMKVLYIHKTNAYTNYIGRIGSSLSAKVDGVAEPVTIAALAADPDGVTSIGNILVWTTSSGTEYAIFRDGTYTYLGDSVPEPEVTFRTYSFSEEARVVTQANGVLVHAIIGFEEYSSVAEVWNTLVDVKDDNSNTHQADAEEIVDRVQQYTWDEVNSGRTTMRGNDAFEAPVLARYALRLYDGNYIYVSAPVILAGSVDHDHMRLLMNFDPSSLSYIWKVFFPAAFTADVRVDFGAAGLWGDLIESVDIFLSTDIYVPPMNAKLRDAYVTSTKVVVPGGELYDAGFEMEGVSDYAWLQTTNIKNRYKEDFETAMLDQANFYKVASIPAFTQAYWEETLKPKAQDDLVVLPRLSEGDAHQITGLGGVGSYNERLILTGEKITLSRGNQKPDALIPASASDAGDASCFFYIRTSDGGTKIVKGYRNYTLADKERARAYIAYPDPACYKAEYYVGSNSSYRKVEIPMKEHPRLNAAYGFWGLGYRLDELYASGDTRTLSTVTSVPTEEDRSYTVDNRLFLSEMNNPFYFPLGQRVTFSSQIIAAMPITIPLSTGQFGQFNLYVFTVDGIWAETITDEGRISASHPVTRDSAIPGSVCQLDQGIVFSSDQGVMLLTGSQVQNISPNLQAERDILGAGGTLTGLGDWAPLMAIAQDGMPFISFIKQATFAYDYPGRRILAFRTDKGYAYVYKLDTGTWHKQQLPDGKLFVRALNSYPEALVAMSASGSMSVVDFTTVLGTGGSAQRTALVITRTIDLGEPDVRKEIRAVKIRGEYRMTGSASYILMGSMDGKYFCRLASLRNGSWKFYKLALLLKLCPDERVSWVDVDFDVRFTNKLR